MFITNGEVCDKMWVQDAMRHMDVYDQAGYLVAKYDSTGEISTIHADIFTTG